MIQMKMALYEDYQQYKAVIPPHFEAYYTMPRTYVMHMEEEGALLGLGAVTTMEGEWANICDAVVFKEDFGLMDGLLRALLNFLDICGIQTVICGDEALFDALRMLRFTQQNGRMELSLPGFFDVKCKTE